MNIEHRRIAFLSLILFVFSSFSYGQEDLYRAEIGVQLGGNTYFGEVNTIADLKNVAGNMSNLSTDVGATFRYRVNKRIALRAGYDFTKVKGDYRYIDGVGDYSTKLNNPIHMFDMWGEFNFYDLENNPYRQFSKKYSPYIFAGIGGMYLSSYTQATGDKFSTTIPFGLGFKVKFAERLNLNMRLTSRLMLADGMEGLKEFDNPPPLTQKNVMNNDLMTGLSIGITYDFWMKDCGCVQNTFTKGKKPAEHKVPKPKREKKEKKSK